MRGRKWAEINGLISKVYFMEETKKNIREARTTAMRDIKAYLMKLESEEDAKAEIRMINLEGFN